MFRADIDLENIYFWSRFEVNVRSWSGFEQWSGDWQNEKMLAMWKLQFKIKTVEIEKVDF